MTTDLAAKVKEAKEKMQGSNPSNQPGKPASERTRIPMTLPEQKLKVPEIPGYHMHWMRGTPARIAQAQAAGYEFVTRDEVQLTNFDLGGDAKHDGNTDLGERVSVVGGEGADASVVRLYLMKQNMEHYLEDQKLLEKRNDGIAQALTSSFQQGTVGGRADGETPQDQALKYVGNRQVQTKVPDLFRKKASK